MLVQSIMENLPMQQTENPAQIYRILLVLLLLLTSVNAAAKQKRFVIGVEEVSYYPLYDFSAADTDRPSFSKELLVRFFEHYNYQYDFLVLPIKRFNEWYVEQEVDFKFPDSARWHASDKTKLNITFSKPVIELMSGSYMLKSQAKTQRQQVKTLSTILGFYPSLWFKEIANGSIRIVEQPSPMSVVKHVLYGEDVATNINGNVIRHNLARLNKSGALVLNRTIDHELYAYHMSSINYPEIIAQFNDFLTLKPKLISELKAKYNIQDESL